MQEDFIGGFHPGSGPAPPPPPPKDYHHIRLPRIPNIFTGSQDRLQDGADGVINGWIPTYPPTPKQSTVSPTELTHMSAVERSQTLKVARMNPHLQFMCGPLLRYDTVDERKVWRGFAMVVSSYVPRFCQIPEFLSSSSSC